MIAASLRHCLARLTRFSGRDRPGQFWPYALVVVMAGMAAWAVAFVAAMALTRARIDAVAGGYGTVDSTPLPTGSSPDLFQDIRSVLIVLGVIVAIMVAFLAAAVVRRLHDSSRTGLWGVVPATLLGVGIVLMFIALSSPAEVPVALFIALFVKNLTYLASLAVLVVLLIVAGTPGPNRYGAPPA